MTNETNTYGHAVVGVAMNGTDASVGVLRDNPTEVKLRLEKNERRQTYTGGSLLCVVAHSLGVDDSYTKGKNPTPNGTATKFVTGDGKTPTGVQTRVHKDLCLAIVKKGSKETGSKTSHVIAAWIDEQVSALTADATDDATDATEFVFDDDDEAPAPTTTTVVTTPSAEVTVEALIEVVTGTPTMELLGNATDILQESGHRLVLSKGKVVDMTVAHPSWDTSWTAKDDAVKTYIANNRTGIAALFSKRDEVITGSPVAGQSGYLYRIDGGKKSLGTGKWDNHEGSPLKRREVHVAMALTHAAFVVLTDGPTWNTDPRTLGNLSDATIGALATMETDALGAWFKDDLSFKSQSWELRMPTVKTGVSMTGGDPLTTALGFF